MAFLDSILKKIKAATLDKTDIDEKIGGAIFGTVNRVKSAFTPEPIHSPIPVKPLTRPTATPRQPIVRPQAVQSPSAVRKLSDVMGNVVSAPYNAVKATAKAITQPRVTLQNIGQYHPKIAEALLKLEKPVQKTSEFLQNPYQEVKLKDIKTGKPGIDVVGNVVVKPLAESLINAPKRYIGGTVKTGLNLGRMARGEKVSLKKVAGDIGEVGQGILDLSVLPFGAGGAKAIVEKAGKDTILSAIKEGAIGGAKFAGTYGFLSGLKDNQDVSDLLDYTKNVAGSTASGAVGGAIVGGTVGGVSHAAGKLINSISNAYKKVFPKATEEEVGNATRKFIRDELGRFTAGKKAKAEPEFYGDMRESIGLPRNGATIEDIPMGLSTKPKGGNEAIMAAEKAKGNQFYIKQYNGNGSKIDFVPVKGKKIEIVPGLDTFIHKNSQGEWVVSDRRTGLAMSRGQSTQKGAIEDFKSVIAAVEKSGKPVSQHIEEAAAKFGEVPNYSQPQSNIKEVKNQAVLDQLAQQAKKQIGITANPKEAGYILKNGEMLDLSGRHYAGGYKNGKPLPGQPDYLANQRNVDHREISSVFGKEIGGTDAMLAFEKEGNIRVSPSSGDLNISLNLDQKLTPEQIKTIKNMHQQLGGKIYYDIYEAGGRNTPILSGETNSPNKLFSDFNSQIKKIEKPIIPRKIHTMPTGEVMAGPEHAGAVPGSTVNVPKKLSEITGEEKFNLDNLNRSRGFGPLTGRKVPTDQEVAMNALNRSRNLSDVMATKPTETKLLLPQTELPTKTGEALQTGQQPTTPIQIQPTRQKPNIMTGQNRSSNTIIAEAKKEIGRASEESKPISKTVDDLYTQWVDRYNPITKVTNVVKKVLKGKNAELRPEADPTVLVRRLTGAGGIADTRFNNELKPIIDEADKLKIDKGDLDVFLKAKRDVSFGSVNREIKGSDPVLGQQRIDALRSKYGDAIDNIANKLYEYQNKGFQEMVDAGFLSKESADLIKQQNPDYVPFNRVMEEVNDYLGIPTRKTMQGSQPIKKIKGSDRMVESPLESIIGNTFSQRAAIEKNNVAKSIVNLQQMAPELGFELSPTAGNDTITVWNNGQKEYWRVGTDIADTAKGLNEENMNALLKIFRAPASLLRQGATGRNPEFMIPNIVRDQLDAGITSKYGYVPFVDYLSGLKSMLTNDEVYQRWERSGAKIDLGEMSGRKSIQQYFDEKGARKGLFDWLKAGLDVMGKYSEQPTRVGLFKKGLKATGNDLLAMMESRDATVDFARMGSKMKVANSIIPFLNVGVQGFDKLIRSVKDNPAKVLTNGLIYGALPAITTTAYNLMFHPQEYAEVPQYEKDSNFVLVKGRNDKGTVDYVTIPKGNILPLISNPIESFMSYAAGESQQDLGQFAAQFISSALPVVGEGQSLKEIMTKTIGSNLPQLVKPAAEALVNKSFYKYDPTKEQAKEIVPSYLQKREPYLQSYEWTPEMYKKIGAVFNVSPLQVQNLMEGYLAGYSKIPAQIIEGLTNVSKGKEIPTNEKTILRRFIKETYPSGAKPAAPVETTPFWERVMPKVGAAERGGQVGGLEKPSETKIANEKYLLQSSSESAKDLGGGVYLIKKDNGDVEKIDISSDLAEPKLTGNDLLDKKLASKYKGKITTRQNDIVDLYTAGLIDEKKAEEMLNALQGISDKVSGKSSKAATKLLKELFKAAQDDIKNRADLRDFLKRKPKGITSTLKKISELTGMKQSATQGAKSIQEILNKKLDQEPLYPGPK